jgi:catechol 2,3-dioxygenase
MTRIEAGGGKTDLRGINHVVLRVSDLEASDRFYGGVLGLSRVGERGRMWFYSAGAHHHDLGLVETGRSGRESPTQSSLFHLCFDVPDEAALARLHRRCVEADVPVLGSVDHNISRSFYVRDPDGNVGELTFDLPRSEWANQAEPFAEDLPYEVPS